MWNPFVLIFLILTGNLGYHFIGNRLLLDALHMTINTIVTVGFGESGFETFCLGVPA